MKNILLLMHRFPISRITDAVGMLLVVAFLAIASLNWHEVNELKIGGPRYSRIVDAKDLVADILPPPMYIVEAFLEANILVAHPDQLPVRSSALSRLKSEYDAERQRWSQVDLPPSMKSTLLVELHREVERFWQELKEVFTPSIAQGKRAEAADSMGRLAEHFESHRKQILALVGEANGYLATAETDARQAERELRTISLTLSGLILAVFVGLTVATRYVVTNPLATVAHRMTSLIKGELKVDIPFQERSNEIGAMASSLVVFRDAMTVKARMEREEEENRRKLDDERSLREQEKTDASSRQVLALRAMVETVERETKTAVGGIVALMQDMTGVSREMSETAGRLSVDSEFVAEAADQTLNAMRQTSKTTAELAASIEQVAGQVQSTRTATLSSVSASKGANEAIHHVAELVDAIGGFAGVITEIALKTKLLALNAGVEAARSGEHGLGFAIIAREVKDLSDQTSKATESINDVIGRVKGTTALALSAVNDIVRSIEAVEKTSGEMAKAVDQQVAATRSIAANVTETERSTAGVTAKI